jgi:hypothetical protein
LNLICRVSFLLGVYNDTSSTAYVIVSYYPEVRMIMNYEIEWVVERIDCDFLKVPSRNLPEKHEGDHTKACQTISGPKIEPRTSEVRVFITISMSWLNGH